MDVFEGEGVPERISLLVVAACERYRIAPEQRDTLRTFVEELYRRYASRGGRDAEEIAIAAVSRDLDDPALIEEALGTRVSSLVGIDYGRLGTVILLTLVALDFQNAFHLGVQTALYPSLQLGSWFAVSAVMSLISSVVLWILLALLQWRGKTGRGVRLRVVYSVLFVFSFLSLMAIHQLIPMPIRDVSTMTLSERTSFAYYGIAVSCFGGAAIFWAWLWWYDRNEKTRFKALTALFIYLLFGSVLVFVTNLLPHFYLQMDEMPHTLSYALPMGPRFTIFGHPLLIAARRAVTAALVGWIMALWHTLIEIFLGFALHELLTRGHSSFRYAAGRTP